MSLSKEVFLDVAIKNADMLVRPVSVDDQFNVQPEILDSLRPAYFLVPAIKNQEPVTRHPHPVARNR